MSSLRAFLNDVAPIKGGVTQQVWIYRKDDNIGNGGRCCLWTVPTGKINVTFELWGGGGGGGGGCCCQFPNRPASGGALSLIHI